MIPKGYKHTEIGILPQHWEVVRLGEVCDVQSGGTPSRNIKKYWENGTIKWLGSSVCKNQKFINEVTDYITEEGLQNSSAKIFAKGTTLIALVGATIGKVAYLDFEASTNQNISGLQPNKQIVNDLFIFYSSLMLYRYFESFSSDKFKMANLSFVRNLQIPLPPLAEQEKIAEILSTWDTQIQNLCSLIKDKQTLKKGLCQILLTAKTRFKGFDKDWEVVRLGEVCENFGGKSLEKEVSPNGQYKFISIGNYSIDGKYFDDGQRISLNQNTQTKLLKKDDLVMVLNDKTSDGKIIGSTILIDKDDVYIYNQRSERLVCSKQLRPLFAWFVLNSESVRRAIFKISQGGTQIYVNFSSVKNLQIPLPPITEQEKIAEVLSEADNEIKLLEQKLESLKSQKKD